MVLIFDSDGEPGKRYIVDGIPRSSVTEILKDLGMLPPYGNFPDRRNLGNAVELAVRYFVEGSLDPESVHEKVRPYLAAFATSEPRKRLKAAKWQVSMFHAQLGYCGTPDAILGDREIADLKTGQRSNWHVLQLAAYAMLLCPQDPLSVVCQNVYLSPESVVTVPYTTSEMAVAGEVWKAAVAVFRWKGKI